MINLPHHTQTSPSQHSEPSPIPTPGNPPVIAIHCEFNTPNENHRSRRIINSLTVFDGHVVRQIPQSEIRAFLVQNRGAVWLFWHAAPALECLSLFVLAEVLNGRIEAGWICCLRLFHLLEQLGARGEIPNGLRQPNTLSPVSSGLLPLFPDMAGTTADEPRAPAETPAFAGQSAQDLHRRFIEIRQTYGTIQANAQQAFGSLAPDMLKKMWERWGPQTHHLQLCAEVALRKISRNGLHLNLTAYDDLVESLKQRQATLAKALWEQEFFVDDPSNANVRRKLSLLEQKSPGIVLPRDTFGAIRISEDDLSPFRHEIPFIDDLLNHRSVTTLLDSLRRVESRGTLHPSFGTLTRTGRTSSFGEINSQGIPRQGGFRRCFVPSTGHVFIGADFGQIELRSLAAACEWQFGQTETQLKVLLKRGVDLHRELAAGISGKPAQEVTSEERQQAKAVNFGCPAGMGVPTLARYARTGFGVKLPEEEAQKGIDRWHATFPEVAAAFREPDIAAQQLAAWANLTLENHAAETGDDRLLWLASSNMYRNQPHAMLGGMAFKVLRTAEPWARVGKPYSKADIDYFWSHLQVLRTILPYYLNDQIASRSSSWELSRQVREHLNLRPVLTLSGRLRQAAPPTARRNTIFQGLAADGAKLALWWLHKAGFRTVNFIHDEVLIEVPETADIHNESERIRHFMTAAMEEFLVDVPITVDLWAARSWDERAESVRDAHGRLQLWEPPEAAERPRQQILRGAAVNPGSR